MFILSFDVFVGDSIEVYEGPDTYFSFRQNLLAKNKSKVEIGEIKQLNK